MKEYVRDANAVLRYFGVSRASTLDALRVGDKVGHTVFSPLEQPGIERVRITHRDFQQLGFPVLRVYEDIPCLRDEHARNLQ